MLSNHLQNGIIDAPKLAWSRLPNSDNAGLRKKGDEGGGIESLDYEVIENYVLGRAQRGKLYVGYYVAVMWFFALLIGIGTGLAVVFINISVENFTGWKFAPTFAIIQKSYFANFVVYVLINLVLVFSSVYIYRYTIGTGSSWVWYSRNQGYLNGVDIHGVLLFRTLIGKHTSLLKERKCGIKVEGSISC